MSWLTHRFSLRLSKARTPVMHTKHNSLHCGGRTIQDESIGAEAGVSLSTRLPGEIAALDNNLPNIQVLGACARRGNNKDVLLKGTVLLLNREGNSVFVSKMNGRKIGFFHPDVAAEYIDVYENRGYRKVVVLKDVDLNDKYGQCFVRYLIDGIEEAS